jgi:hypothetical protein
MFVHSDQEPLATDSRSEAWTVGRGYPRGAGQHGRIA